VVEHSIGNGEVDSSILSGSTIYPTEIAMLLLTDGRGAGSDERDACLRLSIRQTAGPDEALPLGAECVK
jgi:hypothetical protein